MKLDSTDKERFSDRTKGRGQIKGRRLWLIRGIRSGTEDETERSVDPEAPFNEQIEDERIKLKTAGWLGRIE